MTEFKTEQVGQSETLRHLRRENPFQHDEDFLREFESRKKIGLESEKMSAAFINYSYSTEVNQQIRDSSDAESKYRAIWLAHELFPNDIHYAAQLAAALMHRDEHVELAERLLLRVAREEPTERLIFDLANVEKRLGKYQQADKLFGFIETNFPQFDQVKVFGAHADSLRSQGRYEDILPVAEKGLASVPGDSRLNSLKSVALIRVGRPEEALTFIQRHLEKTPDDTEARVAEVEALTAVGRLSQAISGIDKVISSRPQRSTPHGVKANLLLRTGRIDDAIAECEKALQLEPNAIRVQGLKAKALLAARRYAECTEYVASLDQAVVSKTNISCGHRQKRSDF